MAKRTAAELARAMLGGTPATRVARGLAARSAPRSLGRAAVPRGPLHEHGRATVLDAPLTAREARDRSAGSGDAREGARGTWHPRICRRVPRSTARRAR